MSQNKLKTKASRAMILDGSKEGDDTARYSVEAAKTELAEAGVEYSVHVLRDMNIAPCMGCFKCWTLSPGSCVIHDGQDEVVRDWARSDLLVMVTPVTFGGYSSELKGALDRMIPDLLPFFRKYDGDFHHPARYSDGWNLLAIGTMSGDDKARQDLFRSLVGSNSRNMHSIRWDSSIVRKDDGEEKVKASVSSAIRGVIA